MHAFSMLLLHLPFVTYYNYSDSNYCYVHVPDLLTLYLNKDTWVVYNDYRLLTNN